MFNVPFVQAYLLFYVLHFRFCILDFMNQRPEYLFSVCCVAQRVRFVILFSKAVFLTIFFSNASA
jgi:hypothetical protein